MTEIEKLVERVREYLCLGGLFNPEHVHPQDAVRDLVIDLRDALLPREPTDEMMLAALRYLDRVGPAWTVLGLYRAMFDAAQQEPVHVPSCNCGAYTRSAFTAGWTCPVHGWQR